MESCEQLPEWLSFNERIFYLLWSEYNLLFFTVWVRGFFDVSSFFLITVISTLLVVKLKLFADSTNLDKLEEIEWFDSQKIQQYIKVINRVINCMASTDTLEAYLKFFGYLILSTIFMSFFSASWLMFIVGNGLFLDAFMQKVLGIDAFLIFRHNLEGFIRLCDKVRLPRYKDSKKSI